MSAFFLDLQCTTGATSAPPELDSEYMTSPREDDTRASHESGVFHGRSLLYANSGNLGIALEEELNMLMSKCEEVALLPALEAPCHVQSTNLLSLIRRKEKDLILAAKIGKALLARNQDLTKQYEIIHKDLNDKLERMEQERHELRRRLDSTQGEWEGRVADLEMDVQQLQGKLEIQQARIRELDREKNQAIAELSEQNQKLLEQLSRATEAERLLSAQVQTLREDFRKKSISTSQHMSRLETLQAEIRILSERKRELERRMSAAVVENDVLHTTIDGLQERTVSLEKLCHDKDLQLRQNQLDLQEIRRSHNQLGSHLEELAQDRSPDSHPTSLLCEMAQQVEERDQLRVQLWQAHCQVRSLCSELSGHDVAESTPCPEALSDWDPPATCLHDSLLELQRLTQDLLDNSSSNLFQCSEVVLEDQVSRLREELQGARELYEKEQEKLCISQQEVLQLQNQVALLSVELSSAKEEVESLRALAETQDPGEQLLSAIQDRDDAIAKKNATEMELAQCKIDIMSLNSQLLDAIQQKLSLSQQLEAWQDDMLRVIDQQLMDKHQDECRVPPYSFSGGSSRRVTSSANSSAAVRRHGNGDKKLFSFFKKN